MMHGGPKLRRPRAGFEKPYPIRFEILGSNPSGAATQVKSRFSCQTAHSGAAGFDRLRAPIDELASVVLK
jgi:hypothetical protein